MKLVWGRFFISPSSQEQCKHWVPMVGGLNKLSSHPGLSKVGPLASCFLSKNLPLPWVMDNEALAVL